MFLSMLCTVILSAVIVMDLTARAANMMRRRRLLLSRPSGPNSSSPSEPQPSSVADTQSLSPTTNADYYPRNLRDIYHTYFLLSTVLVTDVIPDIMDHAEYWLKSSTSRSERMGISQSKAGEQYIISPAINVPIRRPVRKLEFKTISRDQGWSDYRADHGSYRNSWTWFDAQTVDAEGKPRENGKGPRRIATNVHASLEDKTHIMVWTSDAADEEERKWIRSLGNGDAVALQVMACFPGWVNHVSGAQLDIYTTGLR